jgi:dihydropyrimidinase
VELRLTLLYDGGVQSGRINLNRFVQLTATAPAKMFGLFPQKGHHCRRQRCRLVLFDPNEPTPSAPAPTIPWWTIPCLKGEK